MHLPLVFFLFANSFWLDKPVKEWTDIEISQFFADSPWAQTVSGPARGVAAPSITVYIASAPLALEAEKEHTRRIKLRRKTTGVEDPLAEEYRIWMEDNLPTQIVLAVRMYTNKGLEDGGEIKRMENSSTMQVGKKRVGMSGYFPPAENDPYLRFAFPRQDVSGEKNISFSIYVPGLPVPFREILFPVKDLTVNGKPQL
jgi:hypothetical protein